MSNDIVGNYFRKANKTIWGQGAKLTVGLPKNCPGCGTTMLKIPTPPPHATFQCPRCGYAELRTTDGRVIPVQSPYVNPSSLEYRSIDREYDLLK